MSILDNPFAALTGHMPMMLIGTYSFSLNTAAFQELERKTEYKWVAVERHGQDDALQFVGPGMDTISLPGVIYPSYRGGGGQLNAMRALAGRGIPQSVIDGAGNVYGLWVIEGIDEKQSYFTAFGQPRKQEFTMQLRRFSGGPSNLIVAAITALNPGGLVTGARRALANSVGVITSDIRRRF